jgi:hypothetical protein
VQRKSAIRNAGISWPKNLTKQWRQEARRRNMTLSRLSRIVMAEVFDKPRLLPNVEMLLFTYGISRDSR